MTLKELVEGIKSIAHPLISVNSVHDGDAYEILNNKQIRYGAIIITPIDVQIRDTSHVVNMYIYYADRLINDNSNQNDIFSVAVNTLDTIITRLYQLDDVLDIGDYNRATLFTQKFADITAGAYVQLEITLNKPDIRCQ